MRFEIRYRTLLTFSDPVVESQNELRAAPMSGPHQSLTSYRIDVSPAAPVMSFLDAWGTRVDAFGVRSPHTSMEVVATSTVETHPVPVGGSDVPLDALDEPALIDDHIEYLGTGRHTRFGPQIALLAGQLRAGATDVADLVHSIQTAVAMRLTYERGVTHVGIPIDDVFVLRRGVCQDYAHLAVALCRAAGVPARYVSGYFFSSDDTEPTGPTAAAVTAQTHAWFEAAIPGHDWLALDPTNGLVVGERHVTIGHGRDYDDVLPFRGSYVGGATSVVEADVELQRVGSDAAERRVLRPASSTDGRRPDVHPDRQQ